MVILRNPWDEVIPQGPRKVFFYFGARLIKECFSEKVFLIFGILIDNSKNLLLKRPVVLFQQNYVET